MNQKGARWDTYSGLPCHMAWYAALHNDILRSAQSNETLRRQDRMKLTRHAVSLSSDCKSRPLGALHVYYIQHASQMTTTQTNGAEILNCVIPAEAIPLSVVVVRSTRPIFVFYALLYDIVHSVLHVTIVKGREVSNKRRHIRRREAVLLDSDVETYPTV